MNQGAGKQPVHVFHKMNRGKVAGMADNSIGNNTSVGSVVS